MAINRNFPHMPLLSLVVEHAVFCFLFFFSLLLGFIYLFFYRITEYTAVDRLL